MFSSIRQKVLFTFLTLLLIILVPLSIILQWYIEQFYLSTLKNQLLNQSKIISAIYKPEDFDNKDFVTVNERLQGISSGISSRVTIIDTNGKVLADSDKDFRLMENHRDRPEVKEALEGGIGTETRYSNSVDQNMYYLATPVKSNDIIVGVVRVAVPIVEVDNARKELNRIIYWASAILFLFGMVISFAFARSITNPIEEINTLTKKISEGKFSERLIQKSYDEIGELSNTINRMAATIQEKVEESATSTSKLQSIVNSLDSGILVFDHNGKIMLTNPAILKILDKKEKEVLNKTIIEFLREPQLETKLFDVFNEKELITTQISLESPHTKIIQISLVPIIENHQIAGVLGVFHDITSFKEVEKIRTQFVANASHELKTPLTAVKGFTETLLDGAMHNPATCEKFLKIIDREANRLQKIVNALLKLSLLESEEHNFVFAPLELTGLLKEITLNMEERIKSSGLTLETNIPPRAIRALGDPDLLPQVFYNLLDNAIKYTPSGGKIKITLVEKMHQIKITIEDTGLGIPPEDISRIFERFYRVDKARSREKGGTGLGLAIVKHIIDAHKGMIRVSSRLEKGTSFKIYLPKI